MRPLLMVAVLCAPSLAVAGSAVTGAVKLEGAPPERKPINRNQDPFCGKTAVLDETVVVGKAGGLANVVVRLARGVSGKFTPPETPLLVDQRDCMFRPRVSAMVEGQKIQVRSSDQTLHTVHSYLGRETAFNRAMPSDKTPPVSWTSALGGTSPGILSMKCDLHPWMRGYVSVTPHPFFAVTAEDGAFKIDGVPPGKYTLEAWHEKFGSKTQEITVEDGKPLAVDFSFGGEEKKAK